MTIRIVWFFPVVLAMFSIQTTIVFMSGETPFPTVLIWVIEAVMLLVLHSIWKREKPFIDAHFLFLIGLYAGWVAICAVRGLVLADRYFFYKFLIENTMVLFMFMAAGLAVRVDLFVACLRGYVYLALPLFLLVFFVSSTEGYGYYLAMVPVFVLALPYLSWKWRLLFICFSMLVVFSDFDARSNVIKFIVPFMFCFMYLFGARKVWFFELARKLLFILPVIFFALAASDEFNVFKISEYTKGNYSQTTVYADGSIQDSDLTADTRTFIYEENIESAVRNGYWLFGRTPSRGYDTVWFRVLAEVSGLEERPSSEVAILNVFTWLGLLGVVLYGAVFYRASWLAINASNNSFCKVVGLFVAFRWVYAWIEDFTWFNLNYLVIWIFVGICVSLKFRQMNDREVRSVFDSVFSLTIFRSGR